MVPEEAMHSTVTTVLCFCGVPNGVHTTVQRHEGRAGPRGKTPDALSTFRACVVYAILASMDASVYIWLRN